MEPVSPQLYYLMYFNYFYPQAPHGACQSYFSSALKIYLISILRLRMEPVKMQAFLKNLCEYFYPQAPHGACLNPMALEKIPCFDFYPQAPHGACRASLIRRIHSSCNFYPQAPHGACRCCKNLYGYGYYISILRLRMEPVLLPLFRQSHI